MTYNISFSYLAMQRTARCSMPPSVEGQGRDGVVLHVEGVLLDRVIGVDDEEGDARIEASEQPEGRIGAEGVLERILFALFEPDDPAFEKDLTHRRHPGPS